MGFGLVPSFSPLPAFTFEMRRGSCIEKGWEPTRGVTIYVFVPNRHGTGTSGWLQRWTAMRKCGVQSVNMANVKASFAMRNLKLEVRVPPGPFSQSVLLRLRNPNP